MAGGRNAEDGAERNERRLKERTSRRGGPEADEGVRLYDNVMAVPRLKKIVVNMGVGEATQNIKILDAAVDELGRSPARSRRSPRREEVDRRLQAARGHADRRHGDAARRPHVRVPGPADQRRAAARARLPRRAHRSASTAAATTRWGSGDQLIFPEIDYAKVDKSQGHERHHRDHGADRRGGARAAAAVPGHAVPAAAVGRRRWRPRRLIAKRSEKPKFAVRQYTAAGAAGGRGLPAEVPAVPHLLPRAGARRGHPRRDQGELVAGQESRSMNMTDPDRGHADPDPQRRDGQADRVDVPSSKLKVEIARILKDEGYIANFKVVEDDKQGVLRVYLKYGPGMERGDHRPGAGEPPGPPRLLRQGRDPRGAGRPGHHHPLHAPGRADRPSAPARAWAARSSATSGKERKRHVSNRKKPIPIPKGVKVQVGATSSQVKGPRASSRARAAGITLRGRERRVGAARAQRRRGAAARLHGLARALANNGQGRDRGLQQGARHRGRRLQGRGQGQERGLRARLLAPGGLPDPRGDQGRGGRKTNRVTVTGIDRQKVGQVAAEIRGLRKPDPYKEKGIRYAGEVLQEEGRQGRGQGQG